MDVGELVVKTVMNNKEFEKQYKQLETRYKNKKIDVEITAGELEREQDELERLNKEGEKLQVTYAKIKKEKQQWEAKKLEVSTEIGPNTYQVHDYNAYNDAINNIQKLSNEESKILDTIIKTNDQTVNQEQIVEKLNAKYEKQKNSLNEIKEKQEQLKLKDAQKGLNNINKSIGNVIKSIGKMALAIFGIRSAFSFIRRSMSTLSQYDKQMSADLEYMRWAIATAIKPVIEWIIKAGFTLLNLLNALFYKLFGINLFAHATAKDFQKAKSSAGELKKTLAGFDEMNILNKDGTTGVATSLNFDVNDSLNSFKKFKKALENINWDQLANDIANQITSTLTSQEFWKGVWDTIVWIVKNVFIFPADFLNNILANLFSDNKKTMDSNGKLITEEKSWSEKLVGRLVGAILQQFGFQFNPVGMFASSIKNSTKQINEEVKTSGNTFGNNYATAFMGSFINNFSLYTAFYNVVKEIIKLWNDTVGKLTGKPIKIDVKYNSPNGTAGGRAKGGIYYPQLPKLAVGGIVNQPGRGIPYHGAIIGERGAEAVVPLTDSQQMELLGATIGRYITIQNTNPIYLNGRLIAKEINQANNESDFAYNR